MYVLCLGEWEVLDKTLKTVIHNGVLAEVWEIDIPVEDIADEMSYSFID